jgi:osmoprotectant transport system permease protein
VQSTQITTRLPKAWGQYKPLQGSINEATMIALNARAELQGVAFEVIAKDHLSARAEEKAFCLCYTQRFLGKTMGP